MAHGNRGARSLNLAANELVNATSPLNGVDVNSTRPGQLQHELTNLEPEAGALVEEGKGVEEKDQLESLLTSIPYQSSDVASVIVKHKTESPSPQHREAHNKTRALDTCSRSRIQSRDKIGVGDLAAAKNDPSEQITLSNRSCSRSQSPSDTREITFVDASNETSKYLPWMISFQVRSRGPSGFDIGI